MREAGVSIEALQEYVKLYFQGDSTLEARKQILITQRERLAAKITELQVTLSKLDYKIEGYEKFSREKTM